MSRRQLPPRPSVEQARKQAKDLHRAGREGKPEALSRISDSHPRRAAGSSGPLALHDAQWVLAREYGFASWPALVDHIQLIERVQRDVSSLAPRELVALLAVRDWRVYGAVSRHLADTMDACRAAVLDGMRHHNPKVRRACALLLDHTADDHCIEPLRELLRDPVARVRTAALHSLMCQQCKPEPLRYDAAPDLIDFATRDPSARVRRAAVAGLAAQPPDRRIVAILDQVLREQADVNGLHRMAMKILGRHLVAEPLHSVIERATGTSDERLRRVALKELSRRRPDRRVAAALGQLLRREPEGPVHHMARRVRAAHADAGPA